MWWNNICALVLLLACIGCAVYVVSGAEQSKAPAACVVRCLSFELYGLQLVKL
jgi:hypothetical protein